MKIDVKRWFDFRELIIEFVIRDIKLKYRNSMLGILWSMLNPLLIMIVLTFVFSNVFKNSINNFPVYCLSGRLIYGAFSQATNQGMHAITRKSSLVKKVNIPKYIYPLSKIISSFCIFLISLVPLIFMMIVTNVKPQILILAVIYPLICLFISALGVGLIVCTMNVFFRDMEHLYSVILLIIMYMSAIFYSVDIIDPRYVFIIKLNPIYSIISVFRDCILYGQVTSSLDWALCGIYSVVIMIIGIIIFKKNEHKFIYYI